MKVAICLLATVALLAAPALAEPKGWDAAKAQAIATDLATAYSEIQTAVRGLQPPPPGSGGRGAFHQAVDDLRLLRNASRQLATRLEGGAGFDETLPIYRRIQSVRRDAAENARSAGMIPQDVIARIDASRDLAEQLVVLYED